MALRLSRVRLHGAHAGDVLEKQSLKRFSIEGAPRGCHFAGFTRKTRSKAIYRIQYL
jgi:hypothetical protein